MYVYIESEHNLWTVGFYDPKGNWHPDSDHNNRAKATERVIHLNGNKGMQELENRVTHLEGVLCAYLANNYHLIAGGKHFCERSIKVLGNKPQLEQVECKFEDWDDTCEPAISHCTLVDDFETNNRCGYKNVRDCKYYVPSKEEVK